jgi:dTMP kinase
MNPFIVIEALDAGGSQTQTDLLGKKLEQEGYVVSQYHFPQEDKATGRLIYDKFLLYKNKFPFSKREQALLYISDFFSKSEELHGVVSAKEKSVLLSDRFATSTVAYQTIGLTGEKRKAMIDWIMWLCFKGKPALPKPNIIVFLDTPVAVSLERLAKKKKDFFETKEKLTAIRNSYLNIAKEQKWMIFDSIDEDGKQKTREALHEEIWERVQKKLTK